MPHGIADGYPDKKRAKAERERLARAIHKANRNARRARGGCAVTALGATGALALAVARWRGLA